MIPQIPDETSVDVLVIGSGMGGSTAAWALRDTGASVLVLERGEHLPREPENWSPEAVFGRQRYKNAEAWLDADGGEFIPGNYYYVGGNTKLYGAMLPRLREADFGEIQHREGISPKWPISYADMEPYYAEMERVLNVHANAGDDPTEPWRSTPYPFPGLAHEPAIQQLADRLSAQGLHPFSMPAGVDVRDGGACILCRTCDGFPCKLDAKSDAEVNILRPAVGEGGATLWTGAYVSALVADASGRRIDHAVIQAQGRTVAVRARHFVLAAGAVNSAAILLRSGGLANSSDMVGRNYMVHNSTFMVAVDPRRKNMTNFQKTLAFNDWYSAGPSTPFPLGNIQMLGKLQAPMIAGARPKVPESLLRFMTNHSIDLYLTSEDLPDPDNRVTVTGDGRIRIRWHANNLTPHFELVKRTTEAIKKSGYPLVFKQRMSIETNSHQCGTLVMGEDPANSVVSPVGHTHDIENLWPADSAPFVSSAAVNPAMTIAANTLRVMRGGLINVL